MYGLKSKQYSVAVGGTQKIGFDNLLIINTETKDTLFANGFDKAIEPWIEKASIIKQDQHKADCYEITVNKDAYCYWAAMWFPDEFKEIEYEMTLNAHIVKRDGNGHSGLMFLEDDDNYFSFIIKNGNQAKAQVVQDDDFKYEGSFVDIPKLADGKIEIKIMRLEKEMQFYANGVLIDKFDNNTWFYWPELKRIGLRVCNNQTVAFDKFEIQEIK